MSYENIQFELKEDRAFLTIDRPPMNILNIATMEEMNDAITSLNDSKNIKVLIITGSGEKAFSAGVDVTEHTEEKVEEMLRAFHDIFRNLSKLNQVTVAATKGFTLGGGCEVALFCDMIFAADNLKIGQPEIKLAAIPPIALLIMPRLLGLKKASELLFTGKIIEAEEAERIGLINKVVPLENLMDEARALAEKLLAKSSVKLSYAKQAFNTGLDMDLPTALDLDECLFARCFASEDQKEGMQAFTEKRKPEFKNR